jgi:hypothetical protein
MPRGRTGGTLQNPSGRPTGTCAGGSRPTRSRAEGRSAAITRRSSRSSSPTCTRRDSSARSGSGCAVTASRSAPAAAATGKSIRWRQPRSRVTCTPLMGSASGWSPSAALLPRRPHAFGVPVRAAGIVPVPDPGKTGLVVALYPAPLIGPLPESRDVPRGCHPASSPGSVPRPGTAGHYPRHAPVLGLPRRAGPHQAAHRPAGQDRARVHGPAGIALGHRAGRPPSGPLAGRPGSQPGKALHTAWPVPQAASALFTTDAPTTVAGRK